MTARAWGRSLFGTAVFAAAALTISGALYVQERAMVEALRPAFAVEGGPYNVRGIALYFAREQARHAQEGSK